MNLNLNFRKLEHTIVGSVAGKPFSIARTKEHEDQLILFQTDEAHTAKEIIAWTVATRNQQIASSNKYLLFNPTKNEYFLTLDGRRSKEPIPQILVDFIEESFDKGIDFLPILKAWARFLGGTWYHEGQAGNFANYLNATFCDYKEATRIEEETKCTVEAARSMATYQDIAITQEGLLATYKVADMVTWKYVMEWDPEAGDDGEYKKVRNRLFLPIPPEIDTLTGEVTEVEGHIKPSFMEDYLFTPSICKNGDKFYSADLLGYTYKVGEVQRLPKDARRNLQNTFGGGGLYSGGLEYIDSYYHEGSNHILCCFVDPGDIISFQAEGHAFRTDALMVNNVRDMDLPLEGKGIYNSSDYDKLSTERLDKLMATAISNGGDVFLAQDDLNYERGSIEEPGRDLKEDD